MRTFAIATAAVFVCMRKPEAPAITILPFELVGEEGHGKARGTQGCTNDAIEAIGDDLHFGPAPPTEIEKYRKSRVDTDGVDLLVENLGRHAQQRRLARHAF